MYESFVNIHKSCKRAQPDQYIFNKNSISLHKLDSSQFPGKKLIELNLNQTLTSRQTTFKTLKLDNF